MSLDVSLKLQRLDPSADPPAGSGIFVRVDGQTKQVTREEYARLYPGREPIVVPRRARDIDREEVYSRNVTHNLNAMAREAGIYLELWRPDEISVTTAWQLIQPLRDGLALLQSDPERFKAFNPENGWGDYAGLVDFVADYLAACERWPQASVSVSR